MSICHNYRKFVAQKQHIYLLMKRQSLYKKIAIILLSSCIFACGDDNEASSGKSLKNDNKNTIGNKYVTGNFEFPKVKGGTSKVIVYTATAADERKYGMNYAVEWDCEKKSQRWSCYRFDNSNRLTGKRKDRKTSVVRWYPDDKDYPGTIYGDTKYPNRKYPFDYKNLSADEMLEDLYSDARCDHGHICPSADRLYSQEANIETFFMTNMQPQYANFNQKGLWYYMEDRTRRYANNLTAKDTLYIVKGGTIDKDDQIITKIKNKLIIPKYFYTAYLMWRPMNNSTDRNDPTNYKAMAFWFPHEDKAVSSSVDMKPYMISIDELEKKTGIDFFCNLPDVVENAVEAKLSTSAW